METVDTGNKHIKKLKTEGLIYDSRDSRSCYKLTEGSRHIEGSRILR